MIERTTVVLTADRASFRRVENLIQGIGGSVDIDTSRAESELRDLAQDREMDIRADLVGDEEIQSALNRLDNDRDMDIRAALEGDAEVRSTLNSLDDDRDVTLRANIAGDADIRSTLDELDNPREVKLTASLDEGSVRSQLDKLTRRVDVPIGGRSRASIGGESLASQATAVKGRVAGLAGALVAGATAVGLTKEGAQRTAEAVELRRAERETGINAVELSQVIEAGAGLAGADFEQALTGLKDTLEKLGETAGDPEAGVLGQFGAAQDEIRRVAAAGGTSQDFLNIALTEIQRRSEQDGREVGLALARELGGADESASLLLVLANQQEQFQANLTRVVERGLAFSAQQLDDAEKLAAQARRTAQNNRDLSRDTALNPVAVGGRLLIGDAQESLSEIPNNFFRSERQTVEDLEREAQRDAVNRARADGLGGADTGPSPVQQRAQFVRAELEINEAVEAFRELNETGREVSLQAQRAALLTGQQSTAESFSASGLADLAEQAADIRELRDQGKVTEKQNDKITEILDRIAGLMGSVEKSTRNTGALGVLGD